MTVLAAAQPSCWQGTTREVEAIVLSVDGPANLRSNGQLFPLRLDSHPGRGDVVETPGASGVDLSLLPNLLVHLDHDTSIEIVRLSLVKDGNETGSAMRGRFAEVKLITGRTFVSHVWGEALARLGIATPAGQVVTPSNTLFAVQSEQQKTRVTCASGWVEFQPTGATTATRIPPGSVGEWPSAGPNITAADANPRGQEDLQQAIEIEQKLRDLMIRKRNVLPR